MTRSLVSPLLILAALGLPLAAGCRSGGLIDDFTPSFFRREVATTYPTPRKRLAELQKLEIEARSKPAHEQEQVVASLAATIQTEEDPAIRERILRTLSKYETPLAQNIVRAGVKDREPFVRIRACRLLGERGDAAALDALSEVLQSDSELDVRLAATRQLARFNDPRTMEVLAVALDDPNPALQYRAAQSLRTTTGQDFGNDVNAWRQYVRGETPTPRPVSFAEKYRNWIPFF